MGLLGSIIGGITGLGQSIIDSRTQKRNVDMTNQANMNLAQYQYNKDLEMWNRANEYNSPSAQMARFQQAGLNPNLIYGGSVSGASGNTSTSLPKYQAPRLEYNYKSPVNMANAISDFQDFRLRQAQIDNVKAIARNNRLQGDLNYYKTLLYEPAGSNEVLSSPMGKLATYQAEVMSKRNDLMDKQIENTILANKLRGLDISWYDLNKKFGLLTGGIGTITKAIGFMKPGAKLMKTNNIYNLKRR